MDNRKGDRHRNRARIHASGADKKRKAWMAEEEAAKSRKISEFLTVQPRQVPQTDGNGTDANPPGPEVNNDNTDTDPKSSQAQKDDTDADANPPEADAPESPPGGNDIGLWPAIIPSGMREFWVIKGMETVQDCDEELLSQHSVQQPRNDRKVQRKCTTSLFRR